MTELKDQLKDRIVESKPLRDQVADIVREMILKGQFKAGQQISERSIGQMLNVSTTPVKEAFRSLQAEGLIYTRPRRGSFVSEITIEDMLEIAFMRSALEGVAAYYAAANADEHQTGEMKKILTSAGSLLASGKEDISEAIHHYNVAFHTIIRQTSGNSYLVNQIETLRTIDHSFRRAAQMEYIEEPVQAHKEHQAILDAIISRNSTLSEQRMVTHIRRVALYAADCAKKLQ
ncbi:MAG: GntR family transcriptional regulator [Clostridium sp.]|nr:GntR family transcriptional regulator [Clostridium sp.]